MGAFKDAHGGRLRDLYLDTDAAATAKGGSGGRPSWDLTERQLTRLADYLRLALECTDEKGMTPDRERALESAVAALRESGAYSHDLTLSA